RHRRGSPEPARLPGEKDERGLKSVPRVLLVPRVPAADAQDEPPVSLDQGAECAVVAVAGEPGEQFGIGRVGRRPGDLSEPADDGRKCGGVHGGPFDWRDCTRTSPPGSEWVREYGCFNRRIPEASLAATRRLCAAERARWASRRAEFGAPAHPRYALRCAKPPRRGFTGNGNERDSAPPDAHGSQPLQ